ncbi:ABC transporter ATP-binding protein [Nonomuraea sp. NPDC002799]
MAAHARPHRRALAAVVVLQVFQTMALLYLPRLNADIIDEGVVRGDVGLIFRLGAIMIAMSLVQGGATVGAVYLSARTAMAVGHDLRAAVFLRVQRFSAQEMGHLGVPSLITRTTNDVQQVQTLLVSLMTVAVTAPVMAVGGVALALAQDVVLAWLMLALVPVLGVVVALLIARMRPPARGVQVRIDAVNRVLREQITGFRVTRAFVKQEFERERFERANEGLTDISIRLGKVTTMLLPFVVNIINVAGVLLIWAGGHRVANGDMRIGALAAFLTYLVMIQTAVLSAASVIMNLPRAEVCAARIEEVLRTEPSLVPPAAPVTRCRAPGQVELRGVRWRYPGAEDDVLHGVDLVALPGTTTAIVGSTGSGKSALIGLICRLFDATEGQVLVGGEDVRTLSPQALSESMGLVAQQSFLFSGTVASNLRYGRPEATDEELWRALEIAQARDFVERMDGRLTAAVAQGGADLSGGQRQRLAIARALVRRPPIYLFDDSFSSLDHTTDAALRQALKREMAGATFIVVAQRVHTVKTAERILVLDEGRVAGTGTHEELMRASPVYQEIARSQLEEGRQR